VDEHHWPEADATQRVTPKLSRYQRLIRFLQGAAALEAVDANVGLARGQNPMPNVMGIGMSEDLARDANQGTSRED
jgi:hypothetical protein